MRRALREAGTGPSEAISLVVSPQQSLLSVVSLVAGGAGGRLELPVDLIDDLQLALTTLLRRAEGSATVTIRFEPDSRGVSCRLAPLDRSVVAVLPTVTKLVSFLASDERPDGSLRVTLRLDARPARARGTSRPVRGAGGARDGPRRPAGSEGRR